MRAFAAASLIALILFVGPVASAAAEGAGAPQAGDVLVTVQVALVGADLAVKPVPKWGFVVVPDLAPQAEIAFSTSFEGRANGPLPAGRYRIRSKRPVEFEGKRYSWDLPFEVSPGRPLSLELSNDNAIVEEGAAPAAESGAGTTSEGRLYNALKASVFRIDSESGHGSGFLIDRAGLILTNYHVIAESDYLAVTVNETDKFPAVLIVTDPPNDVAVLRVSPEAVAALTPVPLAEDSPDKPAVSEGERVISIGSPLAAAQILTAGIVGKVEENAIHSDINLNPGNSGGPLFSMRGQVVGINTFVQSAEIGQGVSGIVRIHVAYPTLAKATAALANSPQPPFRHLPMASKFRVPPAELKKLAMSTTFRPNDYHVEAGRIDVQFVTPVVVACLEVTADKEAAEYRSKRQKGKSGVKSYEPGKDFYEWRQYMGDYRPVVRVTAVPEIAMTGGSVFAVLMLGPNVPTRFKFKTDFQRMELMRGTTVVEPIHPGRIPNVVNTHQGLATMEDMTYYGLYEYPPEAFRPGEVVTLRIWEQGRSSPKVRELEPGLQARIWQDFDPYFKSLEQAVAGAASSDPAPTVDTTPQVADYLRSHGGWHDPYTVALATKLPLVSVKSSLATLVAEGRAESGTVDGVETFRSR